MPVYLGTSHAYRSWSEAHPRGFVQRGEGLKQTNVRLATWRAEAAREAPARFSVDVQMICHRVVVEVAEEKEIQLYGVATVATHVHKLFGFRSPACICGAREHCLAGCPARKYAEDIITRMKQKMGQAIALREDVGKRKWFSRGWDLTPVRGREHFEYLMGRYLPEHEGRQGGVFRGYWEG
jgi:hypothetical protein